jgi:hypothetical protein
MTAPTAIPAFVPVDKPPPLPLLSADDSGERPVFAGTFELEGVGAMKVLEVTLKHGTLSVKFCGSTKV